MVYWKAVSCRNIFGKAEHAPDNFVQASGGGAQRASSGWSSLKLLRPKAVRSFDPNEVSVYVRSISADRWVDVYNREEKIVSPEFADLERLVKRLNAKEYTIVTLSGDDDAHMAIGGGAGQYVAYATYDNMKFWNLLSATPARDVILLNVGGQEGDYPARQVVPMDVALQAARVFLETGQLDPASMWEDA